MSTNPHPTSTYRYIPFHRRLFDAIDHTCSCALEIIITVLRPILQKHPNLTPQDVLLTVFLTFISLCLLITSFADGWYWIGNAVDLGLLGWAAWEGLRGSNERYEEEDGWKRRVEFVFEYTTLNIVFSLFDDLVTLDLGIWIWVGRTIKIVWLLYRWMGEGHKLAGGKAPTGPKTEGKRNTGFEDEEIGPNTVMVKARRMVHQASQTEPVYIHTLLGPDLNDNPSPTASSQDTSKTRDLLPSPQLLHLEEGPDSLCTPERETCDSSGSSDGSGSESPSLSADSEGTWNAERAGKAAELEEKSAGPDSPQVARDQCDHADESVKERQDGQSVKVNTASATSLEQEEREVEPMGIIDETDEQSAVGSQSRPSLELEEIAPIRYQKNLEDRDEMQRKSKLPAKQPQEPFVPIIPSSTPEQTAPDEGQNMASETVHPVILAPLAPLRLSRRKSNGKSNPTIQRGTRIAEGKEPAEETTYKALQRFRSGLADLDPTFTFDRRRQADGNGRATTGHRRARTIDVRMSTTARLDELLGFEDEFGAKT
ncbi:hypothetical protein HD553DRAFT_350179 [Filobasidium floriforme]|uniref:uncharacterized protein n=1 Tax=Filobasidium floriforme TaxID=5210 RepID=UPI001E8EC8BC|nr:uncharacterized protein HD553DRAFT_350179 [Filobasidium floriforme]KAH8084775.1 hypothetical protein HD553DRAFT_350179 [Filobasidium floriforme]